MERLDEVTYTRFLELMPVCCVDAVIHTRKNFLLIKRLQEPAKGEWWFPGGRMLKNETAVEAVIRKTMEETGLEVVVEKLIGVYDTMFDTCHFGIPVHTVNVAFLVTPVSGTIDGINLDSFSSDYSIINSIEGCNYYVTRVMIDSGVIS